MDVTKVSAFLGEFLMMIFFICSLITNAGDQQIINVHVVIHENACFLVSVPLLPC